MLPEKNPKNIQNQLAEGGGFHGLTCATKTDPKNKNLGTRRPGIACAERGRTAAWSRASIKLLRDDKRLFDILTLKTLAPIWHRFVYKS